MRCPYCHADNDRVIDSRTSQDRFSIRRRRECMSCNRRYTTYERLEEMDIRVIKKDGVREPFDPEKIRQGLLRACWKRPVSEEQIESMVGAVEREIYTDFDSEIDSHRLGDIVMNRLKEIDQVAYVRFASVYRRFEDVHDFVDELQPMLRSPKNTGGKPKRTDSASDPVEE
ncbi:MAG: transcriptional regulator NrdR [Planctomycetota bacterium]|nr:transcriptional regulator NrdR [Planctomycetota bacterium]